MNDKVAGDLSKSAAIFKHLVYPEIQKWIGKGELIPVETVTDKKVTDLLDAQAGIDGWYVENEKGIRGIASRVQYDKDWNTFTIRYERRSGKRTEYEKLKQAIKKNWIYPYYFTQAYVELPNGFSHETFNYEDDIEQLKLLNVALVKTLDLIKYYEKGAEWVDWYYDEVTKYGAAKFIVIPWAQFERQCKIKAYNGCLLDSYAQSRLLDGPPTLIEYFQKTGVPPSD